MGKIIRIYLSGSIRKGVDDKRTPEHFWSDKDEAQIIDRFPDSEVVLLNPAKTNIERNDFLMNFGADLYLVESSDVMLVDARLEKGIGIGAELLHARNCGVPTITICPRESNYRRSFVPDVFGEDLHNWVHPFVAGLSTVIVDDLDEALDVISARGTEELRRDTGPPVAFYVDRYRKAL